SLTRRPHATLFLSFDDHCLARHSFPIRRSSDLGDRLPDLLVAEPESGQLTVFFQKSDGTLAAPKTFPTLTGIGDIAVADWDEDRSEEHTSELPSPSDLVCRLLLEKKKENTQLDY